MPTTMTDLTPPIGTRSGLPFTVVWGDADTSAYTANANNPMRTNATSNFWQQDSQTAPTAKPNVVGGASLVSSELNAEYISLSDGNVVYQGQLLNITSPVLNFGTGDLEYAQMMLHEVNGRYVSTRTQPVGTVLTFTKAGRYNTNDVQEYVGGTSGKGRPANHTWHRFSAERDSDQTLNHDSSLLEAHDVYAGRYTAPQGGGFVGEGIVHTTKVCLPSNGMGATYGDNHNIKYGVSLNSSPLLDSFPSLLTSAGASLEDSFVMSAHWAINIQSLQPIPINSNSVNGNYKTISQPDGLGGQTTYGHPQRAIPLNETIQYIGTNDFVSDASNTPTGINDMTWRPLGRPDLGNLCVMDSCGLIGYEGVFTATAFMSVSEDAQSGWSGSNQATFAGINIQVHSGTSPRRNGKAYRTQLTGDRAYKYGDTGNYVKPITESLMTTGNRDAVQSASYYATDNNRNDNQSRFFSARTVRLAGDVEALPLNALSNIGGDIGQQIQQPNAYILGDNGHLTGGSYSKTSQLSQDFMKNMIPTKIQVIPALIGHEQIDVAAGDSHPDTNALKFNKPMVDYHVLVSLTPRDRLNAKGTTGGQIGTPTQRNNPEARTFADLNLKDEGCYIYHAIFRIDPTLKRIFVDVADSAKINTLGDDFCPKSVMPSDFKLIQITPFKPIANAGFAQVPLLSGAIEAGGFYQHGGISHHWSADVFNDELFVATDVIEMAHLNSQIYGTGQVKAGGNAAGAAAIPDGPEMVIFKYSPSKDPFYPTKKIDHLLERWYLGTSLIGGTMPVKAVQSNITFDLSQANGNDKDKIKRVKHQDTAGWSIHEWVFPQIEAMRYLGVENKAFMKHPRHSQNSSNTPMLHPTLHVGDFQIMEDGRMKILAIHRDRITTNIDYPSPLIGYPPQPDIAASGRCPAGYYFHDGVCKPINSTRATIPADTSTTHFDPLIGVEITTSGPPLPKTATGLHYMGGMSNFGEVPTWNAMLPDTNARSLVLLFNNKKAKRVEGSKLFTYSKAIDGVLKNITLDFKPTLRYELESNPYIFDVETEDGNSYHNWKRDVGFWSGSQLAYWFQESGQKAIPITYGSYPECRMAFPNFPKCLPHLQLEDFLMYRTNTLTPTQLMQNVFSGVAIEKKEDFMFNFDAKLTRVVSGYPYYQPTMNFSMMNPADGSIYQAWDILRLFPNLIQSYKHLFQTHYNPTTIGFADFGMGANPYQELGWAGWSFAQGLYDPITSNGSQFFSDQPQAVGVSGLHIGTQATGLWTNFYASQTNDEGFTLNQFQGGMAALSHHGPLHYGIMSADHPFKPDRVWKQVNAGLGYEIPLELLIPEKVQVRARAKGKNSLDLELHLPLHRYKLENNPMIGKIKAQTSAGMQSTKMSPFIAQPYLRTNLWNMDSTVGSYNASVFQQTNLNPEARILGKARPSGGTQLLQPTFSEFWKDHPTEHFHAGAIPINTGTDYDALHVANEKYAPALLGNIDSMNKHDYIATAEQLQSSVDVHLSNSIRPFWDSGGIVSARGSGAFDTKGIYNTMTRAQSDGLHVVNAAQSIAPALPPATTSDKGTGLGMGQRIVRTPDGTLHTFSIDRSAKSGTDNIPVWTHYSKPPHSDLFWNRKAVKTNNQFHDGKDEVGPHLQVLAGGTPTNYMTHGAAFASDSNGTIHAVIEIRQPNMEHKLYYTYAKRTLITTQPELVYAWDWSVHTPVLLGGSNNWDLREPSLVCDSKDRLHLACRVVERDFGAIPAGSQILYTIKLPNEATWPPLASGNGSTRDTATGGGSFQPNSGNAWRVVSRRPVNDAQVSTMNMTKGHYTYDNDKPKICLQGDDFPVIFYRGANYDLGTNYNFATAYGNTMSQTSIYANYGIVQQSTTPSGRFDFDKENATMILGGNTGFGYVAYYDAVIDADNITYVSGWQDDGAIRKANIVSWNTKEDWSKHFVVGSGISYMALISPLAEVNYRFNFMTTTISDKDELHMVFGFLLPNISQGDPSVSTLSNRAGTAAPFQWAGTPSSAQLEGFSTANVSWPSGGLNASLSLGDRLHFMEVFIPTVEVSKPSGSFSSVARDVNFRFLSVPSLVYDSGEFRPASSPQTMAGHEDFIHTAPQLRYQQHNGYNAGEIDLRWITNELSWYSTPHFGSKLYYPFVGGATMSIGENTATGEGIAGWL